MLVTPDRFTEVLEHLSTLTKLSVDTETTGLRPYHGDAPFSIIIAGLGKKYPDVVTPFYFNFHPTDSEGVLDEEHLEGLKELFALPHIQWWAHNLPFDAAMLATLGIKIAGEVHCTQAIARVVYNDHLTYNLADCAERIGETKDDTVEKYIKEHKLFEQESIPGKKARKKNKFYHQVPLAIIQPYAERDAVITYRLGLSQEAALQEVDASLPIGVPPMGGVLANERRLTKTVIRMEREGLLIDKPYCHRAQAYENLRSMNAAVEFHRLTGIPFKSSPKLFGEIFVGEKDKWEYTDKNNPSFESDVLKKFEHPAAKEILKYRDAKSKSDFYAGFLYHADSHGYVHPKLNPGGTIHGRFSSSDPNFQNLTSEEGDGEFQIRRAIIPPPGFVFIMPDYKALEFIFMLENAAIQKGYATELVKLVLGGMDVHEATAVMAKTVGVDITRTQAKMSNFLSIYGGGDPKLADALKIPLAAAKQIRAAIFKSAPEMKELTSAMEETARVRGYVRNWLGRRSYFPNKNFTYRAPNYLIAGGCADIVKVAMNRVDEILLTMKSKMVLSVHDELVIKVHENELRSVPVVVMELMETAYTHQYLPLTCSMEWSDKSMADKIAGYPA